MKHINTRLKSAIGAVLAVISLVLLLSPVAIAGSAAESIFNEDACQGDTSICSGTSNELINVIAVVINIMIFVAGIIAVIMIIVGGIQYATSSGDSNSISRAKNTILYAIIGLAVAIMSFAIVSFVLEQFQAAGSGSEDGESSQQQSQGEDGDTENSTPQQPNLARPGVPVTN